MVAGFPFEKRNKQWGAPLCDRVIQHDFPGLLLSDDLGRQQQSGTQRFASFAEMTLPILVVAESTICPT